MQEIIDYILLGLYILSIPISIIGLVKSSQKILVFAVITSLLLTFFRSGMFMAYVAILPIIQLMMLVKIAPKK